VNDPVHPPIFGAGEKEKKRKEGLTINLSFLTEVEEGHFLSGTASER